MKIAQALFPAEPPESFFVAVVIHCFCMCCAIAQEGREIKCAVVDSVAAAASVSFCRPFSR